MNRSKRRAMTWTLVALGIVIVVLAGVLLATFPWSQGLHPFAHAWAQGQGTPPPGPDGWYGYPYRWGFLGGPRFFGGGLLIAALVILVVTLAVRRWRSWGYRPWDERMDAEGILRRQFAEGRITEQEYKSRLDALRR